MKATYNQLYLEVILVQDDIVTASGFAGWQEGDNDLNWGDPWKGNGDE